MSAALRVDRELLWRKLFAFDHHPEGGALSSSSQDASERLCDVIQSAVACGRHEPLRQMLLQRLGYWLRSDVVPPFWSFLDALHVDVKDSRRSRRQLALLCAQQLTLALQFAEDAFAHCVQVASLFDDRVQLKQRTMLQELRTSFRCLVFEDVRAVERFEELLVVFFSMSFHKFQGKEKAQAFDSRPIRQTLLQLQWLHVAEPALLRVLHSQVKKVVKATCGDVYDELYLTELEHWACSELLPWLEEVMQTKDEALVTKWRETLSRHVRQEFGSLRITQLFEIIKEFPDRYEGVMCGGD